MSHEYWLAVFTPDSWHEFISHGSDVAGFPAGRSGSVSRMKPGDHLVFYVMGLKRLVGIAQITSPPFESDEQIWAGGTYPLRVQVQEVAQIPRADRGVPIEAMLGELDMFAGLRDRKYWGAQLRGTPKRISRRDGDAILAAIHKAISGAAATRHTEAQFLLLKLGAALGYDVYVAPNDRSRVYGDVRLGEMPRIKRNLPGHLAPDVSKIIRYIDVLWTDGDTIVGAFEIECTTEIYSGILRMTDMLALQPNLNIPLFLVAPDERREEVFRQITRPTFKRFLPQLAGGTRYIPIERLRMTMNHYGPDVAGLRPDWIIDRLSEACSAS